MIGCRPIQRLGIFLSLMALCCAAPRAACGIEPDCLIDSDPKLEIPEPIRDFNPAMKTLWLSALDRPETDMQRMAAETIARAHRFGVPGLTDAVPRLQTILEAEQSHPAARFAAARALIVLESRVSSEKLWSTSQRYGADLRQLVEPALAAWDFGPAKEVWIKRLDDPATRHRDLILALRGLAQTRASSALSRLLAMTRDPLLNPAIRLEAAAAAGQATATGLEEAAALLSRDTASSGFHQAQLAVRLLARHEDHASRELLIQLAGHPEPAVAAAALSRLTEIDQTLVLPLAESAMQASDPHVRWQGASAYLNHPAVERVGPLAELLSDPHPGVRSRVADGLYQLCENEEWDGPIRQAAMEILSGDRWQGQEQAALLLGALKHQPAAARLVELLESPRQEVLVIAAWALRKVAVAETVPALIDKATRQTEIRKRADEPGLDEQVVHLCEALGVLRADDAVPLLTQYIPKNQLMGERSRSAAIWALGLIKEGKRDAELESALSDRINDFDDVKPESDFVKQLCAITLVRMNAVEQAPGMRGIVVSSHIGMRLGVALRWAVKELTGDVLPPPEPSFASQGDWFLQPFP